MKLIIFGGTLRKGQYNGRIAQFVLDIVKQHPEDWEAELVTPGSLNLRFDDEGEQAKIPELSAKVAAADAFIIVSPEYNHSIPGSLKYVLDMHLKEYIHKPVALMGVSDGNWGGVRAIEAWAQSVREMGLISTFTDVQFAHCDDMFEGDSQTMKETEQPQWQKRVERSLTELKWMATSLKWGRDNLTK